MGSHLRPIGSRSPALWHLIDLTGNRIIGGTRHVRSGPAIRDLGAPVVLLSMPNRLGTFSAV